MSLGSKMTFAVRSGKAAARCAGIFAGSLLSREQRIRLQQMSYDIGCYEVTPSLSEVSLDDIVSTDVPLVMQSPQRATYQVTPFELAAINQCVASRRPMALFEIGTFDGRTTRNLHLNAPDGAVIHTIDLPPQDQNLPDEKTAGSVIRDLVDGTRLVQLYGNSLEFDFTPWHGTQDFVFVDAGHSFECVTADSATALALTKGRNAMILWHDYAQLGDVTRALDAFASAHREAGRFAWIRGTSLGCLVREAD